MPRAWASARSRVLHVGVPLQQPQQRIVALAQQRAPQVEDFLRDLVRLVEAAQQQRVLGHAPVGAGAGLRPLAPRVVGLVAKRHLRDLLGEVPGIRQRRDHRVADQVVDVRRAGAAGKAQPGHLQRRRPRGQHRQRCVVGGALQVDQDVDAEFAHAPGHLRMALPAQFLEMLDRRHHAAAQRAAIVGAGGQREDLEGLAVVLLQHLHQQLAGGMGVEVGRQVAQAQPACVRARLHPRQAAAACRRHAAHEWRGHLQLLLRVVDQHCMAEGRSLHRLLCRHGAQRRTQALQFGVGFGPATGLALQEHQLAAGRQVAAADAQCHRGAHALGRLGLHAQLLERGAQVEVQVGIIDLQRQRLQEHRHRFGMSCRQLQCHGQRHQVGMVRRDAWRAARSSNEAPRRADPARSARAIRACSRASRAGSAGAAAGRAAPLRWRVRS